MTSEFRTSQASTTSGSRELNCLLVGPRISLLPYPQNIQLRSDLALISVGLAYVSSSLKARYRNIYNLNLEFDTREVFDAIAGAISGYKIDVVFTGGISGQFSRVKKVLDSVKMIDRNIITVVGGLIVTATPEVAMKALENADIGVVGEGEVTACELVAALESGAGLDNVDGLIYKKNDRFVRTTPRREITDLDALPFPDLMCLEYDKHRADAYVHGSRSCPFHCTFCFRPSGSKYRVRSIDSIISEVAYLKQHHPIKSICFSDELFLADRKRTEEFCARIKPYDVSWSCSAHANTLPDDLLPLLRESGCSAIVLGVESASNKVLKSMRKGTTIQRTEEALQKIYDNHIMLDSNLIFGDVAEDQETLEETISWWRKNRRFFISLTRIRVFPGTAIYNHAVESGKIPDEVEFLRQDCPYVNISRLTDRQYQEMSLRLTTEEAFYPQPPESFTILEVNTNTQETLARYKCSCGHTAEIRTRGMLLSNDVRCPVCGHGYTLPYHERYSAEEVRGVIYSLIREYGPLAFWGLGREMQLLLRLIGASSIPEACLIDRDAHKQGLVFMDKVICAPDILKQGAIRVVVPTPILGAGVHYTATIEEEIAGICAAHVVPFGKLFEGIAHL
jgi:anaerobic magnesium-protoporphyrin IX monomethyl ester cyclase